MCLYPKLIRNKKYIPNKKNKGLVPVPSDHRALSVAVGCGKCIECRNQKARAWSVRLQEEIRTNFTGTFITLTISNESYKHLVEGIELEGYARDNQIATLAVKMFLNRWRKKHGKSVKHWLVTELGHNGTENVHLHGIIFSQDTAAIEKAWQYGFIYFGTWVNLQSINYMIKYVSKIDDIHKYYVPKILCSPGIGAGYASRHNAWQNRFKDKETKEYYTTDQGVKLNLPVYYRNKLYDDEQRERLWINRLDKHERYVCGTKVDISKDTELYNKTVDHYRLINSRLGYGDNTADVNQKKYENDLRDINHLQRLKGEDDNLGDA